MLPSCVRSTGHPGLIVHHQAMVAAFHFSKLIPYSCCLQLCGCYCRVAPEFLKATKKDAAYDLDDCPLIVFINARSGGRVGPELANKLARALGRSQVHCNISRCCLKLFAPRYLTYCCWFGMSFLDINGPACCAGISTRFVLYPAGFKHGMHIIRWHGAASCTGLSNNPLPCTLVHCLSQVFDLATHRPDTVLQQIWRNFDEQEQLGNARTALVRQRLRILACGGDGTVAWIMKVIHHLDLKPQPAVAIMPLGTGRGTGW